MKLSDLLAYDDIVIQCHDNPDSDALLLTLDLPWNLRGESGLIGYYTEGLNLEAILFLIRELNKLTKVVQITG